MRAAEQFVTKEELEPMKADIQKLTIRVEVLTQDLHHLTLAVGDLSQRVDKLEKTVIDGNAALMSAILNLTPRTA